MIGAVALRNPIRENVRTSIQLAKRAQIKVRLVSGDHLETAKAIAEKAGILTQDDLK